ncbi:MAG: hypothetical protein J7501_16175 [Bdellovibrio sp.]|nr:hypothetical protein [Bdellovibrio sp.]
MKALIYSLVVISASSALASGFYDRSNGLYTKADSYQELSWCAENKVVREASDGSLVVEADCAEAGKTCDSDPLIFNRTVIYRAVCK